MNNLKIHDNHWLYIFAYYGWWNAKSVRDRKPTDLCEYRRRILFSALFLALIYFVAGWLILGTTVTNFLWLFMDYPPPIDMLGFIASGWAIITVIEAAGLVILCFFGYMEYGKNFHEKHGKKYIAKIIMPVISKTKNSETVAILKACWDGFINTFCPTITVITATGEDDG